MNEKPAPYKPNESCIESVSRSSRLVCRHQLHFRPRGGRVGEGFSAAFQGHSVITDICMLVWSSSLVWGLMTPLGPFYMNRPQTRWSESNSVLDHLWTINIFFWFVFVSCFTLKGSPLASCRLLHFLPVWSLWLVSPVPRPPSLPPVVSQCQFVVGLSSSFEPVVWFMSSLACLTACTSL